MSAVRTSKTLLFLLRLCAAPQYRDALIGDVIELHQAGRSHLWCWRQLVSALIARLVAALDSKPWFAAIKALILALGMITFGMGTLVWAESLGADASSHHSAQRHP